MTAIADGFRRQVVLAIALVIASCAPVVSTVDATSVRAWFPFIEDGRTMRADIRTALGTPPRTFERGRIVSYRFRRIGQTLTVTTADDFTRSQYELMLSFDSRHVLVRHNLLQPW